jgi:hypothetical protein
MTAQMRTPYPPECRGLNIDGVEMILLDADIYGIATWYDDNNDPMTDHHRALLTQLLDDLDRIWHQLPTEGARLYYATARDLGRYLIATRVQN